MVKHASHKRQDSAQRKSQKDLDPRLKALMIYLAEWAAEHDFETARAQQKDSASKRGKRP